MPFPHLSHDFTILASVASILVCRFQLTVRRSTGGPGGASPWSAGRPLGEPPEATPHFRAVTTLVIMYLVQVLVFYGKHRVVGRQGLIVHELG